MGRSPKPLCCVVILATALLCSVAWAASSTTATVLTNLGGVVEGTLSGLGPSIRLDALDRAQIVGPIQQFDLPLSSIRQLTVDFPRVILETTDSVLTAPYSAFQGIAQILTISTGAAGETYRIPFASVRAIALHGAPLRPVPREWMGDRFLSGPEIAAARPLEALLCADCEITPPASVPSSRQDDSPLIWGAFTPDVPEEEPSSASWIGLVALAALIVVFLLVNPGS